MAETQRRESCPNQTLQEILAWASVTFSSFFFWMFTSDSLLFPLPLSAFGLKLLSLTNYCSLQEILITSGFSSVGPAICKKKKSPKRVSQGSFNHGKWPRTWQIIHVWRTRPGRSPAGRRLLIPKNIGNRKWECAWSFSRWQTQPEKICKSQRTNQCHSLRTLYWFVLCNLQIFSSCVCHLEQLHAQSPFLSPIVFGNISISFFDIGACATRCPSLGYALLYHVYVDHCAVAPVAVSRFVTAGCYVESLPLSQPLSNESVILENYEIWKL